MNRVKLPKIELPKFSGHDESWYSFRDTFKSLISNNETISNVEKLNYLKASLSGEASRMLDSLEITDENYSVAWSMLNDRYDNEQLIIQKHIDSIFKLPACNKENHHGIRLIVDGINKHVRALKMLKCPTEHWDQLLIYLVKTKLDPNTIKSWESTLKPKQAPTFKELMDFLSHRCQVLDAVSKTSKLQISCKAESKSSAVHIATANQNCNFCKGDHTINRCEKFLKLNSEQRYQAVKKIGYCINCLRYKHPLDKCLAGTCQKCHKRHNTLLHRENSSFQDSTGNRIDTAEPKSSTSGTVVNLSSNSRSDSKPEVLLATAQVLVSDANGQYHEVKAVLDSCSQSCFITERVTKRLHLKTFSSAMRIVGINNSPSTTVKGTKIIIKSRLNNFKSEVQCYILQKITENLPQTSFAPSRVNIPKNIKLADPNFNVSSEIDLLIGAELFWSLLCVGRINIGNNMPILQKTHLGWIISGKYYGNRPPTNDSICNLSTEFQDQLEENLTRFWQLEEYPSQRALTKEEKECEEHFTKTYRRSPDGRFIVKLPIKTEKIQKLGDTYDIARRRFYSLERKLKNQPELKTEYANFIHEYLDLGHMKPSSSQNNNQMAAYLPHHGVIKESSTTTKLRVVFDASVKSATGTSLNDALMVGPTLQEDLVSIIIRFRTHRYVVTADITKMYRQVLVDESQTSLQRILWRDDEREELKTYELKTVTYGTASASYLAIRSLQQLAEEEQEEFPLGATVARRDFYVDDLLTGASTEDETLAIATDVNKLLLRGGFVLRKWVSNKPSLIRHLNSNITDHAIVNLDKHQEINTLGLQWHVASDSFKFHVPIFSDTGRISKRKILSEISRLFDPLGFLAPVVIVGKLLIQNIWELKLNWDESVPQDIHNTWTQLRTQLPLLNSLIIPRWIINDPNPATIELHGFCDASEKAYGACIYLRASSDGSSKVSLICAKSKVAPIKKVSLPRLELCGALLLARLIRKTLQAFNFKLDDVKLWTDSTITLAWINSSSRRWKTFVANRVSEIQELTKSEDWRHVSTHENPADLISRGVGPADLIKSSLWWSGPEWLVQDSSMWPTYTSVEKEDIPESRNLTISAINVAQSDLLKKYSTFKRLVHVMAYILRFKQNLKNRTRRSSILWPLSVRERENATTTIIKMTQEECFGPDLHQLLEDGSVSEKSRILSLNPFLDPQGIIRVGGRLRNAKIPYNHKHPILLPNSHHVTKLIISDIHKQELHAGIQNTLAAVRTFYWPINGKNIVKQIIRQCTTCFIAKPTIAQHIMGDLPDCRVTPSRPFANVGIDYFGPLQLKESKRRNARILKGYGAVFICMATKAIHMELVSDLTAEAFIAAMKRFVSRRGKPFNIYSDNATNFVGAKNEMIRLHEMFKDENDSARIVDYAHDNGFNWNFIPPKSPHFGGIWEAAVKSAKHHIIRLVGKVTFTTEEMSTLLTQIEAVLNSRPLTPLSNDPNDFLFLTPAHFLIGDSLKVIPEPELLSVPISRLSRWQHIENIKQHFWKQWNKEYLSCLQTRTKWKRPFKNLTVGQMVLIRDDNAPPFLWPMGRIHEVHAGPDGIVRAASVRTSKGIFKRASVKLCPLPLN